MSPEQARRKKIPVDHRTDVYSLGATMYEAICGRPPFRGRDYADTLSQIIERDPVQPAKVNPRVPVDLETIVLKCLRKNSVDRYGTAEALGQDLRRFVRGDPTEARPESFWERAWRRAVTHRKALTGAAVALTLVAACGVLAYKLHVEAREDRSRDYDRRVEAAAMKILHADTTAIKRGSPLLRGGTPPDFGTLVRMSLKTVEEAVRDLNVEVEAFSNRADAHYWRAGWTNLLGARSSPFDQAQSDAYLVRIDSSGDLLWERTFSGARARSVERTRDGGYIMVGSAQSSTGAWGGLYLVKIAPEAPRQRLFRRGDCNDDGNVDMSDAVCILNWLFAGDATPGCVATTNTNGDDAANISDATYMLKHLFCGGLAPVAPFPDCGPGTLLADADLGCARPPNCQ